MRCPGCGWEQPLSETCVVCGVRLTQRGETAAEARRREYRESQTASRQSRSIQESMTLPVTRPLKLVRALVGAGACGIATYILIIQEGVVLNPMAVLVVLAYGFVGLYWILSALVDISLRQFLLEMMAFLIATVGLRMDLPEAFDSEQLQRGAATLTAKLKNKAVKGKEAPGAAKETSKGDPGAEVAGDLGEFEQQLQSVVTEAKALVDAGVPTQEWLQWKALGEELRSMHNRLAPQSQEKTESTLRKLGALERAMEQAAGGSNPDAVEAARKALDALN